ncbi:hypothetical protein D3C75_702060 [compost metagenome]
MLLQILFVIWSIFVDQVIQLQNIAVLDCFLRSAGEAEKVIFQHIRQLTRCQHDVKGFIDLVGWRRSEIYFDPRLLLPFLIEGNLSML